MTINTIKATYLSTISPLKFKFKNAEKAVSEIRVKSPQKPRFTAPLRVLFSSKFLLTHEHCIWKKRTVQGHFPYTAFLYIYNSTPIRKNQYLYCVKNSIFSSARGLMVKHQILYFSEFCNPPASKQIPAHLYYAL